MINKINKTYQNIFKNFGESAIFLATVFFVLFLPGLNVLAQADQNIKNWDQSNSELSITSPVNNIEVDQNFYLRYTQNINSFEKTSKISWNITNNLGENVFSRTVLSNKDKNDAVNLSEPGSYTIELSLKVESSDINTTKKLRVLPKNNEYFSGLTINEIDVNNSQIELFNNSNRDLDTTNLFLAYSQEGKYQLSSIDIIPSKSFAVYNISPKIQSKDTLKIVYIKSSSNNEVFEINKVNLADIETLPDAKQSLQYDSEKGLWKNSIATFGQKNTFDQISGSSMIVKANSQSEIAEINKFNRTEVIRTGGQDISLVNIIPFLLISLIFITNLIFENRSIKDLVEKFKTNKYCLAYFDLFLFKLLDFSLRLGIGEKFSNQYNQALIKANTLLNVLVLNQITR